MPSHELIVVGAGALGAATAWQATEHGLEDVLVLDRGAPCSGTSPRGAGLVSRLLWRPEEVGFVDRSIELFRELDAASGSRFTFHDPGAVLIVGSAFADEAERMARVWRAQALEVKRLGREDVEGVPGLHGLSMTEEEQAYLSADDGWAVTTDAVTAMLDRALDAGAHVEPHTPVTHVDGEGVHLDDGRTLTAEATVVAAGVWTRALFRGPWRPPVQAYRAQACVLGHGHAGPPGPVVHDTPRRTYWRPEGEGKLVMGDGTDLSPHDVGDAPRTDEGFARRMAEHLRARWPEVQGPSLVSSWAGFEAATPDARPLVGPVPGMEGVHLCVGGNGFGFMRSPALGEVAARGAMGLSGSLPAGGLRPRRFEDPPGTFEMQEGFEPP